MNCDLAADDATLIADVLDGQRDRFQELIQNHQNMVYGVAWSQLGSVDLAEEAAQQTFVKAYCSLAKLRDPGKFKGWLATIARNVSVTLGRTRRRELSNTLRWEIESPVQENDCGTQERANLTDELRQTLAGLPDSHRQVLTLFYLQEQSVKQVALALELSESAVKTRLNRARNLLRDELERRLEETLSDLSPSQSLVLPIMAALPSSSPIAAVTKLSLLAKTTGFVGKFGLPFVSMLPGWLVMKQNSKRLAKRFQEDPQHDFRREIALGYPMGYLLLLVAVAVGVQVLYVGIELRATFLVISVFCLWGIWKSLRSLRVNDSAHSRAMVACGVIQFITYSLIGAIEMPLNWIVIAIGATIILLNVINKRYSRTYSARNDYNLLLRAATGGVADAAAADIRAKELNLNSDQLKQFARFLGSNYLISDYQLKDDGIRLEFPPANPTAISSLYRPARSKSSAFVGRMGDCDVYLSDVDQQSIEQLSSATDDRAALVEQTKNAIQQCVADYTQGNHSEALGMVQVYSDDQIFKETSASESSRRHRLILFFLALILTLFWAASFVL